VETKHRLGLAFGGISIALSIVCFVATAVLTPACIIAAAFGLPGAAAALAFKARRTATVAFVFAFLPCAFLFPERIWLTLVTVALLFPAWIVVDYLRARHATVNAAA